MSTEEELLKEVTSKEYEYGFETNIESDTIDPGLTEAVVRLISEKKDEPQWLLDWRLDSLKIWQEMTEPQWAHVRYDKPDFH